MKHIKIVLSFMLFSVLVLNLSSQDMDNTLKQQDNNDSIITGKKYRFILFNDKEIIGRVTKQDSVQLQMKSENTLYQVNKNDIFEISSELTPSRLKAIFWTGGGLSVFDSWESSSEYKKGFTMQLSGMYPFSDNRGIRIDLSFSQSKKNPYSFSPNDYTSEQTIRSYYIRANYIFGTFSPSDKFKIYGYPGIGISFRHESDYTQTYYSGYENQTYTYTNPGFNYTTLLLSAGGGAGYMINKRIGFYCEAEYNLAGYLFIFGGGYFLAKAGVIFNVY